MLIPNSLNPENQTRSDARTAYFDGFIDSRPNFHVAYGQLVIRLIIDSDASTTIGNSSTRLLITGVEVSVALSDTDEKLPIL
jgi:hypothetical protein